MPKRKRSNTYVRRPASKRRRASTRNRTKRGRRAYGSVVRVPRNIVGMADSAMVKLKYCEELTFAPAAGFLTTKTFSGNSLYQPNIAGGHQPRWYDTWAAMFSNYRVYGCKIKIRWVNRQGGDHCRLYIVATTNILPPILQSDYCEHAGVKIGSMSAQKDYATQSSYRSSKSLFDKPVSLDIDTTGATGASPATQWFWHMGCHNIGTTVVDALAEVECVYYAKFTGRKQPSQS